MSSVDYPLGRDVVYVCPSKDIVCGTRPQNWCDECPLWNSSAVTRTAASVQPEVTTPVPKHKILQLYKKMEDL